MWLLHRRLIRLWMSILLKKIGVNLTECPSYIKTVNSMAQAIVGMAFGVSISTRNWVRTHNLMVVPLGEFEIILEIDFVRKF